MFPWFVGVLATPPDRIFGGVNRWSADYYIYLSFIETGMRGSLREYHLTSTKPQEPILIHGVYTISGYLGKLIGLDSTAVYHLDRLILGGIFIGVLFFLYRSVFKRTFWAGIALLFVFCITGFPKTLDILGRWDWRFLSWVQELNIVGRSTSPPHYLLGFSLYVIAVWYFIEGRASVMKKSLILAVIMTLGTIANPVNLLILWSTLVVYGGINAMRGMRRIGPSTSLRVKGIGRIRSEIGELKVAFLTILWTVPIALYYQQKLSIFPWGPRSNALKFYIPASLPIDWKELFLALGPTLVFAIIGVGWWIAGKIRSWKMENGKCPPARLAESKRAGEAGKMEDRWGLFFFSWILVQFGLLSVSKPWGVDPLRFLQGLYYIPLAAFATVGVREIGGIRWISPSTPSTPSTTLRTNPLGINSLRVKGIRGIGEIRVAVVVAVISFLITLPTLILSYREHLFMNTDYKEFASMIYPTLDQYQAYKFMEQHTPFTSGVIAYYEVTEVLPAFSGNTTERDMSHGDKTKFFANQMSSEEALAFLKANRFSYVWLGYQEKAPGFNPALYPFLQKVFENKGVTVYKVGSRF